MGGLTVAGYFIGNTIKVETEEEKQKWSGVGAGVGACIGLVSVIIAYYYYQKSLDNNNNLPISRIITSRKEQQNLEKMLPGIFDDGVLP
jgi:hypothetical protein